MFRDVAGRQAHVIVKFSDSDASPGTVRWSDLLVCEHLALCTVARYLNVQAAVSRMFQADGRTFLEVERIDRHGRLGRSDVCSWAALNGALFGLAGKPWLEGVAAMRQRGLVDAGTDAAVKRGCLEVFSSIPYHAARFDSENVHAPIARSGVQTPCRS